MGAFRPGQPPASGHEQDGTLDFPLTGSKPWINCLDAGLALIRAGVRKARQRLLRASEWGQESVG